MQGLVVPPVEVFLTEGELPFRFKKIYILNLIPLACQVVDLLAGEHGRPVMITTIGAGSRRMSKVGWAFRIRELSHEVHKLTHVSLLDFHQLSLKVVTGAYILRCWVNHFIFMDLFDFA